MQLTDLFIIFSKSNYKVRHKFDNKQHTRRNVAQILQILITIKCTSEKCATKTPEGLAIRYCDVIRRQTSPQNFCPHLCRMKREFQAPKFTKF